MGHIFVTGGAGYIGSHTVHFLLRAGHQVTVADNLTKGYRHNLPSGVLQVVDLAETKKIQDLLYNVDAVIHFAALIAVGESAAIPEKYFTNNVSGTISLFQAMVDANVRKVVFSSTAAVYGNPQQIPIPETLPIQPVNPYGETKAMVEKILDWMDEHRELRSVRLRYFNACGAEPGLGIGEEHDPETHLIPLIFRAIHSGKPVTVFGRDYPTPDGTCIRDYVHVTDLAQAHLAALKWLDEGGTTQAFNCGTGRGYSVLEVIQAVEEVTGKKVPHQFGERREGDPPELVADSTKLQKTLGWKPRYTDLKETIRTAWEFELKRISAKAQS